MYRRAVLKPLEVEVVRGRGIETWGQLGKPSERRRAANQEGEHVRPRALWIARCCRNMVVGVVERACGRAGGREASGAWGSGDVGRERARGWPPTKD